MTTPIKPGTARRLGLLDPTRLENRFRHYPQRWMPSEVSDEEWQQHKRLCGYQP